MKKHVAVLEQAGLVTTEKVGRVRTCRLGPHRLQEVSAWIERYRQLWGSRFDQLVGTGVLRHVAAFLRGDVRVGGTYRFVFGVDTSEPMAFYGKCLEVAPNSRLVWTNEEGGDGGAVTTVTFEERGGKTLVVVRELHLSKEALDAARASGVEAGTLEAFGQLDEFLVALGASAER